MADVMFNIARGCAKFYYYAVKNSLVLASAGQFTSTSDAGLMVIAIDNGGTTEDVMRDYDTLADLLGDANVAEVTNTGYERKELTEADLAAVPSSDDVNNRFDLDLPDQTWSEVQAGDSWTDLVVCFVPDVVTPSADSAIIPISLHDFAVTPDGTDIIAQINTAGFYRSADPS